MLNQSQLGFSAFHAMFADLEQRIKAAVIVPYDLDLCKEFGRVELSLAAGRNVPANDLWQTLVRPEIVTYRESWPFDLTPGKQSLLEPCSATIYRIALSKLFLEQIAFSTGIPHLQGQQNDQRQQYIPTMHRKRNSANG